MQVVSSRIWTRVAVSISYDDNHYTTGTSLILELSALYINTWNHLIIRIICVNSNIWNHLIYNKKNWLILELLVLHITTWNHLKDRIINDKSKYLKHEGNVYTNCCWGARNSPQKLENGIGKVWNQRTRQDYPD